ncbi:unnamed protein product [Musa acuminata subsp. burmannicoides]
MSTFFFFLLAFVCIQLIEPNVCDGALTSGCIPLPKEEVLYLSSKRGLKDPTNTGCPLGWVKTAAANGRCDLQQSYWACRKAGPPQSASASLSYVGFALHTTTGPLGGELRRRSLLWSEAPKVPKVPGPKHERFWRH